jgi:hypothetical protein
MFYLLTSSVLASYFVESVWWAECLTCGMLLGVDVFAELDLRFSTIVLARVKICCKTTTWCVPFSLRPLMKCDVTSIVFQNMTNCWKCGYVTDVCG